MISHPCRALGCATFLTPGAAFCSRHGRMVPLLLQGRLLAAYRQHGADSREYLEAMHEAITTIAERERASRQTGGDFKELRAIRLPDGRVGDFWNALGTTKGER